MSGTFSQGTAARDLPLQRSASTPSPGIINSSAYGFASSGAGGDDSSCESEGASDSHPDRYDDSESPGPSGAFSALAAMIPVINPVGIGQEGPPAGFGKQPGVKVEEGGPGPAAVSMPRISGSGGVAVKGKTRRRVATTKVSGWGDDASPIAFGGGGGGRGGGRGGGGGGGGDGGGGRHGHGHGHNQSSSIALSPMVGIGSGGGGGGAGGGGVASRGDVGVSPTSDQGMADGGGPGGISTRKQQEVATRPREKGRFIKRAPAFLPISAFKPAGVRTEADAAAEAAEEAREKAVEAAALAAAAAAAAAAGKRGGGGGSASSMAGMAPRTTTNMSPPAAMTPGGAGAGRGGGPSPWSSVGDGQGELLVYVCRCVFARGRIRNVSRRQFLVRNR